MSDTMVRAGDAPGEAVSAVEGVTAYAVVTTDLDRMIRSWNQGARRLYGDEPSDVIRRMSSADLWDPPDVEAGRAAEAFQQAAAEGAWEGEVRRICRDGKPFVADLSISTLRDAAGEPSGFVVISRDLTETRRTLQELREQQTYNRGLIESSIDALMTTDPLAIITDVNRQMCVVTGYSREELIGTRFKLYCTDPRKAEDGIRRVLSEDRVTNYELTIRGRDGRDAVVSFNATRLSGEDGKLRGVFAAARDITDQKGLEHQLRQAQNYTRSLIEASVDAHAPYPSQREVLVSFNASIFRDPAGNVRGVFAVARDVTEQRRLEEELREQQNYSRGLIEAAVEALVTVNPLQRITDVDEQMIRLTGYTRQQLVGRAFTELFTDPERAAAGVRQTFQEGIVTNYELVVRSRAGSEIIVSFNASTFKDTAGKTVGKMNSRVVEQAADPC